MRSEGLRSREEEEKVSVFCEGKERFLTFALADRVARLRRREGTKRHAYRCGGCGGYHIGSTIGQRARRPVAGMGFGFDEELAA